MKKHNNNNINNHKKGTIVHSAVIAQDAFKIFLRGVLMIFIGNLLWIITEEACNSDNGWKSFPGLMFYNLFTFYGYSMITIYIVYLHNDLKQNICYFQSLHQRKCNIVFIWFHWLFPSISPSKRLNHLHNQSVDKIEEDEEESYHANQGQNTLDLLGASISTVN